MTTQQEKYDKIRLIRRELCNTDPIEIENFAYSETDILLKTNFSSNAEIRQYSEEFEDNVFFSGDGLVFYDYH